MSASPEGPSNSPTATELVTAMHGASGAELTELGRRFADQLDREQSSRDNEIAELRHSAQRLDRAVADLMAATSSTELLRRGCAALADICSADRVLASSIGKESDRAVPIATYQVDVEKTIPAVYSLDAGSAESLVVVSRGAPVTDNPVVELRHLFPQACTIMAVTVDNAPAVLIHVAGELAAAQFDSAALLTELLGGCLQRLGLAARRTRQLELLRSSGITRDEISAAEGGVESDPTAPPWMEPLTERESEVVRLILRGSSNTAIATELVITVDTVKSHVKRILRKMGATNRSELIARHSASGLTNRPTAPPSR